MLEDVDNSFQRGQKCSDKIKGITKYQMVTTEASDTALKKNIL